MIYEIMPNIWITFENTMKERLVSSIESIQIDSTKVIIVNIDDLFEDEQNFSAMNRGLRQNQIRKWKYHLEEHYIQHKLWKKIFFYSMKNADWVYFYILSWIMWNGSLSKEKSKGLLKRKMESYYQYYKYNMPMVSTFWDEILSSFEIS